MKKYLFYNTEYEVFTVSDNILGWSEMVQISDEKINVNVIHGFIHMMIEKHGQEMTDTDTIKQEWLNFNK